MNATISAQETTDKKYTVYKISIDHNEKSWFVLRRYHEFSYLLESLKKSCQNVSLKLPGKKIFGTLDPKFIKQRKEGLNEFVSKLLEIPHIWEMSDVREFFGIDRQFFCLDSDNYEDNFLFEKEVNLGPSESKLVKPEDFHFIKTIGKGNSGKVFLARRYNDGAMFGVKVLYKESIMKQKEMQQMMSENNVLLKSLQHPFICHLHISFQTKRKLYFFLDYVNGGELFVHLQRERFFSRKKTQFYAAEIGCALGYLHSQNIIYRDFKPENILLDAQGHVVLTEFGLCKEALVERKDTAATFCGTPEYLAPEIIKKEVYDRTVDWWSFGSLIYEMIFGLAPFYSQDTHKMYQKILYSPLVLKENCPHDVSDILLKLLTKDPTSRLGYENDFEEIKLHPFFEGIDWTMLMNKEVKPPIVPNVSLNIDIRNIDPEFHRDPISTSSPSPKKISKISMSVEDFSEQFNGFSFAAPSGEITTL